MLRELITVNPRSLQSNPRKKGGKRKHRAKLRRNPRFGLKMPNLSNVTDAVLPAALGAGGALGVDIAIGAMGFIPPEWKAGTRRTLLRAGVAVAIGVAARMLLPSKFHKVASQAVAGALTVTAYDAAKTFVAQQFPDLTLGMYDGDLGAYERVGYDSLPTLRGGVGAYVPAGSGSNLGMIPVTR
jgi:hypothetical protein